MRNYTELIKRVKEDISIYTGEIVVAVWYNKDEEAINYTDYAFIGSDKFIKGLLNNDHMRPMTLTALSIILELETKEK